MKNNTKFRKLRITYADFYFNHMFLAAAFSEVVAICAMSHFIHFVLVLEKKSFLPLTSMYET